MNGYQLTRNWYNYKFENPDKVRHVHSDMYFYIVDLWNRLGQKEKIGLPTSFTMNALGIGSYNTYKKALKELIDFGFIREISESRNQYQSRIIALSINDKATNKALDSALSINDKATDETPDEATDSIIEQKNNRTINNNSIVISQENISELTNCYSMKEAVCRLTGKTLQQIDKLLGIFIIEQEAKGDLNRSLGDLRKHFTAWAKLNADKYGTIPYKPKEFKELPSVDGAAEYELFRKAAEEKGVKLKFVS